MRFWLSKSFNEASEKPPESSERRRKLEELQNGLGIKFIDVSLLNQALTHTSYANSSKEKNTPHNERLEFLGDAVLEIVIADYLFHKYSNLSEGELSKLRSNIVSQETLSQFAREIKIGEYLLIGENQEGIQSQDSLLADAYEAIIGALYIDRGLKITRRFILTSLIKKERELIEVNDFKSQLQEYTQSVYNSLPKYRILKKVGPEHHKKFKAVVEIKKKILGEGWGYSKKKAEKMAAQSAWEKIIDNKGLKD
ncbi:MAG: ribonuclease III [Candidatus Aerophobetes bacterium]|nr:ribonuclease III [Candidatus Aerophobetes bacterium]